MNEGRTICSLSVMWADAHTELQDAFRRCSLSVEEWQDHYILQQCLSSSLFVGVWHASQTHVMSTRLTEKLEKPHTHSLTPFSCWAPLMCCKTLSISCSMRRAQCMILHKTHNKTITQWKSTASAVSFMTEIRDLNQCSILSYNLHFI